MGGAHWRVPDIRSRRRFYPACGGHGGAYGRLVGIAARVVWGPSLVPLGREASKSPSRAAPLPKQRLRAAAYRHSPGCTPGVRPTRIGQGRGSWIASRGAEGRHAPTQDR